MVVDAFQPQGIGRRLLHALSRAALTRGIDRLRTVLADNEPIIKLLSRHAPGWVRFDVRDDFEVEVRLDPRRLVAG